MPLVQRPYDRDTAWNIAPDVDETQTILVTMRERLNATLLGKAEVVEMALAGLLARGHILVEDLPGLGKTTLAKAVAGVLGGRFARVQCTPDLLPADITGFNMFNQRTREFEFVPGPVFCEVLLADEINRTTPRTQSALFEAMAERQVTIDGTTHMLSKAFFVIATQNPLESHGVYPLPEAQLDRFTLKLRIGYPNAVSESLMLEQDGSSRCDLDEQMEPVICPQRLTALQHLVASIYVAPHVRDYLVRLGSWTREHAQVHCGLSPRALLAWQRLAKAWAFLKGRAFVVPDDIQIMAESVVEMRLVGDFDRATDLVRQMLNEVAVPVAAKGSEPN